MNSPASRGKPRRDRRTRPGVRVAELVARCLISIGGIGTIIAVTLICVFLLWVVTPLFLGATVEASRVVPAASDAELAGVLEVRTDEYRRMVWVARADGSLDLYEGGSGERLAHYELFGGEAPTAASFGLMDGSVAYGFADGSVVLGRIGFATEFVDAAALDPELRDLAAGEAGQWGERIVERTPEGQFRAQALAFSFDEPLQVSKTAPIVRVDHSILVGGPVFTALDGEGNLTVNGRRVTTNLLTGKETFKLRKGTLPYTPDPGAGPPDHVLLSGAGDNVFLIWSDGRLLRFDARDFSGAQLAEAVRLVEPGVTVTAVEFAAGKTTLLVGDDRGRVRGWFATKPDDAETPDGAVLEMAQELTGEGGVTALGPSPRSRLLAVAREGGALEIAYVTGSRSLARRVDPDVGTVRHMSFSPKENGVFAMTDTGFASWDLDPRHPEASLTAMFRPVWYEGYEGPDHVWQSSSGTDDFEPKLGLWPIVFGTIKATFYSMLFGVPIAILAAIYSSEFLDRRLRVSVKSTIEIMAGLPSVVLGFLAAIVIAPFVQAVLPGTLACFVTVPFALLLGAYLWQLLPQRPAVRLSGWPRFVFIAAMIPLGVVLAAGAGPIPGIGEAIEGLFFAGDVEAWLSGELGGPVGGWMILFLPLGALASALLLGAYVSPRLRNVSATWDRRQCALLDLGRFGLWAVLAVAIGLGLSLVVGALGFDARGSYVGTYLQRNALIVGFIMGFAIIPIIYTIAEDALSSVPEHLRLASLGAGATPWQTAIRVIIPTAMSGLFSAVMIGLGRAVGETMIVLMATGNTPVRDWNMFSGFRTLSANIAVELPEAVKNDTHYRTLFFAALVLFGMTFVVNTAAELVRQRFRKRAFQL